MSENDTVLVTVTLSRAHKLVERIGAAIAQARDLITKAQGTVKLQCAPTTGQRAALRSEAQKAMQAHARIELLVQAAGVIRGAVGEVNASAGINARLTRIETLKRMLGQIRSTLEAFVLDSSWVQLDAVDQITWPEANTPLPFAGGVRVTAYGADDLEPLRQRQIELERELYQEQDRLAELNVRKVSFELPAEAAKLIGL